MLPVCFPSGPLSCILSTKEKFSEKSPTMMDSEIGMVSFSFFQIVGLHLSNMVVPSEKNDSQQVIL